MLADGEIDILGSVSYTPERAESIDYSTEASVVKKKLLRLFFFLKLLFTYI